MTSLEIQERYVEMRKLSDQTPGIMLNLSVLIKNSTSGNLSCSNSEAFNYFRKSFEDRNQYSGFPAWVEDVMPVPPDDELMPFDMSPVTRSVIKGFLKSRLLPLARMVSPTII